MRIAATADLHFAPQSATVLRDQLDKVRNDADLLIIAGDLTNYGRPVEMEPLLNTMVRLRVPIVAVLGNHDYESEQSAELIRMMTAEGIKVLDGSAYERDGVGFAGTKGFVGGFGRGALTGASEAGRLSTLSFPCRQGLIPRRCAERFARLSPGILPATGPSSGFMRIASTPMPMP